MGCKAPKPGGDFSAAGNGYGPQRRGKGGAGAVSVSPYGGGKPMMMPQVQIFPTPSSDGWQCICGFSNKPQNQVCGGTGPMGCKSPKPGAEGHLGAESYGPQRTARKGGTMFASPYAKGGAMTTSPGGTVKVMQPGEWACRCGFSNKANNTQCGGNGPMGCNAPKEWQCLSCGFNNKALNEVCGGKGTMGCKSPWQMSSANGMGSMPVVGAMPGMKGKGGKGGMMMPGATMGKAVGEWECAECGFKNKGSNTQCGGTGPMGCNAARPEAWECPACNFKNKPSNQVCGGSGNLGCKAPKP